MAKTLSRRERQRLAPDAGAHCPACASEYIAGTAICADCGSALVAGPAPEASTAIPMSDDLVAVTETEQMRAVELAADLDAAGIAHHLHPVSLIVSSPTVEFKPALNPTWQVFVRPADIARARAYVSASDAPLAMVPDEIQQTIAGHTVREMLEPVGVVLRWGGAVFVGVGLALLALIVVGYEGSADELGTAFLLLAFGAAVGLAGLSLLPSFPDAEASEDGA